jgi:hypothetical protein
MSKEFWEALESDESSLEQDCELLGAGDGAQMRQGDSAKGFQASMSLICPETGKVTMHTTNELRGLLQQFRVEQNTPACHMAHQLQPRSHPASTAPVAVDDELHGPDGEWLVVEDATPGGEVFTLFCCETGDRFRRTASAVLAEIGRRRLKVYRPGMPHVPRELEENPGVFVNESDRSETLR